MRSVWNGTITFGLAAIPVKAYSATEESGSGLHQIHTTDGGRIRLRRTCELDGADVPFAELGKGVELPDGDIVPLSQEDLAGLPAASSHAIEVRAFTPVAQIDPLYFDRSYYLAPEPSGAQPYALLAEALCQSVRVAVVTVALRQRETLAMVRERDSVLVLTTLHWPDQVRTPDFPALDSVSVSRSAVRSAVSHISRLSGDFSPSDYADGYRAALDDLVAARVAAGEVLRPTAAAQEESAESLVSALRDRAGSAAAVAQARAAERKAARKAAAARAAAARASRRSRAAR